MVVFLVSESLEPASSERSAFACQPPSAFRSSQRPPPSVVQAIRVRATSGRLIVLPYQPRVAPGRPQASSMGQSAPPACAEYDAPWGIPSVLDA